MINKYISVIDHETFEIMFHEIIKYNKERPRKIITTVVPESWQPPKEVINSIKDKLWINGNPY